MLIRRRFFFRKFFLKHNEKHYCKMQIIVASMIITQFSKLEKSVDRSSDSGVFHIICFESTFIIVYDLFLYVNISIAQNCSKSKYLKKVTTYKSPDLEIPVNILNKMISYK